MTFPSPADHGGKAGTLIARIDWLKGLVWRVLEAGFLLIGVIVLIYLLLGAGSGPFVLGVIDNLSAMVAALTPQALIGLAIVVAITAILQRR